MPGHDLSELRDLIPENGDTSWDGPLNEVLEGILDDIEPDVRASEIDIDSDLEVNDFALTEVGALQLTSNDEVLDSPTDTMKFYGVGNEAYFTDGVGNVVRFTLNGVLDVSSAGGIAGDYGDSGSNVSYSDISKLYTFEQGSGLTAHIRADQVQLQNGASATRVTLEAPSTLSASYTWTLPTAVPTSTSLVQVSSAGVLSNTRDPSVDTITATSATIGASGMTVGAAGIGTSGAISATGLITATGGITVGNNQDVTIQGTGKYNRGALVTKKAGNTGFFTTGTGNFGNRSAVLNAAASDVYEVSLDLQEGQRLTGVSAQVNAAAAGTVTMTVWRMTDMTSAVSIGSDTTSTTATEVLSVTGLTEGIISNTQVVHVVEFTFTSTGNSVQCIAWTTDVI